MAFPDLIQIEPVMGPVTAEVTVPGSKSITNRALVLAALAKGKTILRGALWSEDTQVMVEALQNLGFEVGAEDDPAEACNRTITVLGKGGEVPNAGNSERPLKIYVGNAGTAARFLAALVCLGKGSFRLEGAARMHERPQKALFLALRELGYRVEAAADRLPAIIHGAGPQAARCRVDLGESSQFASALLLCARAGGWQVDVVGENAEESPYVRMTQELIEVFPARGGEFQIEPDASSGSYFYAADRLINESRRREPNGKITVRNWPTSGWQIDANFTRFAGPSTINHQPSTPNERVLSRARDLGDSIMTEIVLAPLRREPTRFIDLGRLRLQECERVAALRSELTKCGAKVIEEGDTLTVFPSKMHGAEIETYEDHRMAMCFAVLSLAVPGMRVRNPRCVKKTFPDFFAKLAAQPPEGLGAVIRDEQGRVMRLEELMADG